MKVTVTSESTSLRAISDVSTQSLLDSEHGPLQGLECSSTLVVKLQFMAKKAKRTRLVQQSPMTSELHTKLCSATEILYFHEQKCFICVSLTDTADIDGIQLIL